VEGGGGRKKRAEGESVGMKKRGGKRRAFGRNEPGYYLGETNAVVGKKKKKERGVRRKGRRKKKWERLKVANSSPGTVPRQGRGGEKKKRRGKRGGHYGKGGGEKES